MPLHRDFLMRMIERFSAAFFRIMAGKDVEAPEQALFEIEELVGEALGTSREFALGLGPAAIDNVAPQLAAELARLLMLHAKLSDGLGDERRAERSRVMGFRALERAIQQPAPAYASLAAEQLREHFDTLAEVATPAALAAVCIAAHRVAAHREAWDEAEDWLFFALDHDPSTAHIDTGRAFYNHLAALSDAELTAGGLTREEITESLADLEDRQ